MENEKIGRKTDRKIRGIATRGFRVCFTDLEVRLVSLALIPDTFSDTLNRGTLMSSNESVTGVKDFLCVDGGVGDELGTEKSCFVVYLLRTMRFFKYVFVSRSVDLI